MAIDHVFRTEPQLGPPLLMHEASPWYDAHGITSPSYQLGQIHQGSDGHEYVFVKAGAALSGSTAFTIAEATWTTDTGTGWTLPVDLQTGGVASGEYFHARRATL